MIEYKVFRYTIGNFHDGDNLDFENMFHYLVKNNEPKLLKKWLLPKTNYFTNGGETSPLKLTTVTTAANLRNWLQGIADD